MLTYHQGTELYYSRMGTSLVVFHEGDQEYFRLNETAAVMWELLREPRREEDLTAQLRAQFEIDEATCRAAVAGFLQELISRRLIVCSDSSAT
jgi:hypothetical protein